MDENEETVLVVLVGLTIAEVQYLQNLLQKERSRIDEFESEVGPFLAEHRLMVYNLNLKITKP